MMTSITVTEAREGLADLLNEVAFAKKRIAITRRNKDVAVLVCVEDVALLEQLEDRMDIEAARQAIKEGGSIPWSKLRKQLGL